MGIQTLRRNRKGPDQRAEFLNSDAIPFMEQGVETMGNILCLQPDTPYRVVSGNADVASIGDIISFDEDECFNNWTDAGAIPPDEISDADFGGIVVEEATDYLIIVHRHGRSLRHV